MKVAAFDEVSLGLIGLSLLAALVALLLMMRERWKSAGIRRELQAVSRQKHELEWGDALTGLRNRKGLDASLDDLAHVGSHGVVVVLLDHFRRMRQAFGQEFGDFIVKLAAQRLSGCLPPGATAAHLEGGEFALAIPGNRADLLEVAELAFEQLALPVQSAKGQVILVASLGVAMAGAPEDRGRLIEFASLAAERAGAGLNGEGKVCVYDPAFAEEARAQAFFVNDLRAAVENKELRLLFQPKVDAQSLQITAAEALLRWQHPVRGNVAPAVFVPMAESAGLMGMLGRWVIEESCRVAASWRAMGLRMRVAVNISALQMQEEDLVDHIAQCLERHGLQPNRFTCEITESVAMQHTDTATATFERMRSLGLHVSIDDFGTGYSSLAALRRLPASELKVDRAFVADLEHSEDARSIAASIVSLGKALNLKVVAEGVETQGQCELLMLMGCDELQGFLFSKPISAEEMTGMINSGSADGPESLPFSESLFMSTRLSGL